MMVVIIVLSFHMLDVIEDKSCCAPLRVSYPLFHDLLCSILICVSYVTACMVLLCMVK